MFLEQPDVFLLVLMTVFIGLLNVFVGFGVAMYLGYGPPGLKEAWSALDSQPASPGADVVAAPSTVDAVAGAASMVPAEAKAAAESGELSSIAASNQSESSTAEPASAESTPSEEEILNEVRPMDEAAQGTMERQSLGTEVPSP